VIFDEELVLGVEATALAQPRMASSTIVSGRDDYLGTGQKNAACTPRPLDG
jgi:hypothetical protein